MNDAITQIAAKTDVVTLGNAFHGFLLRQEGDYLNRIEQAQASIGGALMDVIPAFGSTAVLALLLFLAAYALRPVPSIILPGIGAYGFPSRRKRKKSSH